MSYSLQHFNKQILKYYNRNVVKWIIC